MPTQTIARSVANTDAISKQSFGVQSWSPRSQSRPLQYGDQAIGTVRAADEEIRIKLSAKRLEDLNRRRDAETIKSNDLPPKLRGKFPGEFAGLTLDAIRVKCGKKKE